MATRVADPRTGAARDSVLTQLNTRLPRRRTSSPSLPHRLIGTCRSWNLQILTRRLESGDDRHHEVGIAKRHVLKDADESFRIDATNGAPGTKRWISTQGHPHAQILVRTLLANPPIEATIKVIQAKDVPAEDRR